MNAKDETDDIRTTIYLPKVIHKRIKLFAVETDTSASEIIREAVKQYLAQKAAKSAEPKAATPISQ